MNLLAPRLDLRQSQSLVMTPQLRQAIKLLQSSNLEVTAFVEQELERNPLLERDERAPAGPDDATGSNAAGATPAAARLRRLPRRHGIRHDAGGGRGAARRGVARRLRHGRLRRRLRRRLQRPRRPRRLLRRPLRHRGHGAVAAHPARAPRRADPARLRRPGRPADRGAAARAGRRRPAGCRRGRGARRGAGLRGGAGGGRARADAALRSGGHVLPRPARMPRRAACGAEPAGSGHGRRCSTTWSCWRGGTGAG